MICLLLFVQLGFVVVACMSLRPAIGEYRQPALWLTRGSGHALEICSCAAHELFSFFLMRCVAPSLHLRRWSFDVYFSLRHLTEFRRHGPVALLFHYDFLACAFRPISTYDNSGYDGLVVSTITHLLQVSRPKSSTMVMPNSKKYDSIAVEILPIDHKPASSESCGMKIHAMISISGSSIRNAW